MRIDRKQVSYPPTHKSSLIPSLVPWGQSVSVPGPGSEHQLQGKRSSKQFALFYCVLVIVGNYFKDVFYNLFSLELYLT